MSQRTKETIGQIFERRELLLRDMESHHDKAEDFARAALRLTHKIDAAIELYLDHDHCPSVVIESTGQLSMGVDSGEAWACFLMGVG